MAEIDDDKTTTYGSSDINKTEIYGNSENQKTTAYNTNQEATAAYHDLQNKEFKSKTHGIGVGDKLTLRNTEFTMTGIISEGTGEAVIYKVENGSKQTFALKLYFEFSNSKEEPNFETLKRIKDITDPDILKLHDFGVGGDKYQGKYCYEISDFAEGGDLFAVANFKEKYTKEFLENCIVPEILNGIRKLHEFKIYHCDLKPSNIFFKDRNQTDLLIGDYGSAKAYDLETIKEIRKTSTVKGTETYLAPEQPRGIISEKNDYYSFGIILLHLLYPEQFSSENNTRQVDKRKFEKIVERQYNSQPVIDLNPSYKRLNNLIEGLTLINHINRFGKNEVEKWLNGEEVEVKYKATESGSVYAIKLGYATIKTDKDFIQVIESQPNWYDDLIEPIDDKENRDSNLTLWLDSYRDMSERKLIVAMIKFYQGIGKEYVKESLLRYFDPEREIRIDMHSFNFFTTENIIDEVERYICKLDEIYKITSFEKVRFYLFQIEFSLKQLSLTIDGQGLILVNSIIEKISSAFGITPESFVSRKTWIQDKFSTKNEKESYIKLLNLFYIFFKERKYIDTKNRKFDDLKEIALSYADDETLFDDKFCVAELTVYLRNKQLDHVKRNNYSGFLFSVFQDHIKSNLSIESIKFSEKTAKVNYKFKKSLTEFFSSKGIMKIIVNEGDDKNLELQTKLIPSGNILYNSFISSLCKVHGVNEQSFEKNSLNETNSSIRRLTMAYRKKKRKIASTFSSGLAVYSLPVILAIIGAYVLLFTPQTISDYLYQNIDSDKDGSTLRTATLIGYIYGLIIISLIPSIIFWMNNNDNKGLHSNFDDGVYLIPHKLAGGIIIYSIGTVIIGFVLTIILFIVVGIGSLFGDYKTDPTVDLIMNFVLKLSAFVVFVGAFRPLKKIYENIIHETKIIKRFISMQVVSISIILILIITAFSMSSLNILGSRNEIKDTSHVEIQIPKTKLYIITAEVANVRSEPSTKSQIIGQVKINDLVEVVSQSGNDWYKIKYNTSEAYIHTSLLKEKN